MVNIHYLPVPMVEKAIVWLGKFGQSEIDQLKKNTVPLRKYMASLGRQKKRAKPAEGAPGFSNTKNLLEQMLVGHVGVNVDWSLPIRAIHRYRSAYCS